MDENVVIANITKTILEDGLSSNRPATFQGQKRGQFAKHTTYPLLESDDSAFDFFIRLQQRSGNLQQTPTEIAVLPNCSKTFFMQSNVKVPSKRKKYVKTAARRATKRNASVAGHWTATLTTKRIELNLLNAFSPNEFESFMHMSKICFLKIFKSVRSLLLNTVIPDTMTPQTVFSLALWKLATDMHFEEIARKFGIPLTTCQETIRLFWQLISNNYERFIEWPNTPQSQAATVRAFRTHPHLPNMFSILATRQMSVFFESENWEILVIVQIICNADHKVIDCFVELAQDYAFDKSPVGQTMAHNKDTIQQNSYLIGDKEMPLKSYLIRPFNVEHSAQMRFFNARLQSSLKTAQQVLDAMAKRFNIMYALEAQNLKEVRQIIETVCALHNLCIDIQDDYVQLQTEPAESLPPCTLFDGGEKDSEGVQRRSKLMSTMPAVDFILIND